MGSGSIGISYLNLILAESACLRFVSDLMVFIPCNACTIWFPMRVSGVCNVPMLSFKNFAASCIRSIRRSSRSSAFFCLPWCLGGAMMTILKSWVSFCSPTSDVSDWFNFSSWPFCIASSSERVSVAVKSFKHAKSYYDYHVELADIQVSGCFPHHFVRVTWVPALKCSWLRWNCVWNWLILRRWTQKLAKFHTMVCPLILNARLVGSLLHLVQLRVQRMMISGLHPEKECFRTFRTIVKFSWNFAYSQYMRSQATTQTTWVFWIVQKGCPVYH